MLTMPTDSTFVGRLQFERQMYQSNRRATALSYPTDLEIKVFVRPVGLFSPAMVRIANALGAAAPSQILLVDDESDCDVSVMYVIGGDYIDRANILLEHGKQYVPVQCCLKSAGYNEADIPSRTRWYEFWAKSMMLYTYYDFLDPYPELRDKTYLAPLGTSLGFLSPSHEPPSNPYVVTSGHVHGAPAEAILEVWEAARIAGLRVKHVGTRQVQGIPMSRVPKHVTMLGHVTDSALAQVYQGAKFVAALRYVEGFELPAMEGLASGAIPVLFDQRDLRLWYGPHARYVNEHATSAALVNNLVEAFQDEPNSYPPTILYPWPTIADGFWRWFLDLYLGRTPDPATLPQGFPVGGVI